jgi:transcriptional regulator with XRE-family HTH domain
LITERLKTRRDMLGLTQKQVVGRLTKLGVQTTNRTLSNLEHGAGVDVARLPELAMALECTVTYLLGLTDSPHRWIPDPVPDPPASATPRPSVESRPLRPSSPSVPSHVPPRPSSEMSDALSAHSDAQQPQDRRAEKANASCWILGRDVPDRHFPVAEPGNTDE